MDTTVRKRLILISSIIATLFIVLIIAAILNAVAHSGKIPITITAMPSDAQLTVDGKTTSASTYVTPGTHTFIAKKTGFNDAVSVLKISKSANTVSLPLAPNSTAAWNWYYKEADQSQLQQLGSRAANERGASLRARFPLLAKLPYISIINLFSIDYGFSGTGNADIYFIISDSSPDGRVNAFKWIKQQGFNPATLDIRYNEFKNPLTNGVTQ